ncbi:MAG: hypothetical protein LBD90_04395 [Bifidobacteriaceae bacterium]|nr:hypothetical protein [Bifidobacteriaceae bacterium]
MITGRVNLGLLERDSQAAEALSDALLEFYPDQIAISLLANTEQAQVWARRQRPGVLLVDQARAAEFAGAPAHVAVAVLVDGDQQAVGQVPAICRYLAVDAIFGRLARLFAGVAGEDLPVQANRSGASVIAFTSPQGGVGTTSMAIAFARRLAKTVPNKVLYLDLRPLAEIGHLSAGRGGTTMTDVVLAAKSRTANLPDALAAAAARDQACGLYFFPPARTAADVMELSDADLVRLYETATGGREWRFVVLDVPFAWAGPHARGLAAASLVVMVTNGRPSANLKVTRAVEALDLRAATEAPSWSWTADAILYNQFSSTASSKLNLPDVPELGGAGRFVGLSAAEVVEQLEASRAFDALLGRVVPRV